MILTQGIDYTVDSAGNYTFAAGFSGRNVYITYQQLNPIPAVSALQQLGLSFAAGNVGQGTWGYLQSNYPTQALGYSGLSYLYAPSYDLGATAEVPNHSFEVSTPWEQSFTVDADPGAVINDMLTNGRYGANFPSSRVGSLAAVTNYARAQGLLMSPALTAQKPAADWLRYLLDMCNSDCTWSQSILKFVPLGDVAVSGNGVTYTPNTTPQYDLTEDHFLIASAAEDGVQVQRKSTEDAYNHVRVEYFNRGNQYNTEIVEAKDAADIDQRGLRTMNTVEAHALCDPTAARTLATLLLGKQMAVRNTYKFKLPWVFGLLEPLDLLTLSYAPKGLVRTPVRINKIDELDTGDFELECEDAPIGMATAPAYGVQAGSGFAHDYNAAPGNVIAPTFFEAPVELTTGGLEVYAAVSGSNPAWGGCSVWASLDGLTYKRVDRIAGGSRYGTLDGTVDGVSSSIAVHLAGLGGKMLSGTAADAAALNTLCWIDGLSDGGEYVTYQTATLGAPNAYGLSGLMRGAYRSTAQQHLANAKFVRVDDAIAKSGPIDLSFIGQAMFFKFTSFNVYGGGEQALSEVSAYSYTIKGGLAKLPPPDVADFTITGDLLRWDPVSAVLAPDLLGYELRFQYGMNTDWATAAKLHTGGVITETQFSLPNRPSNRVTFLIKAVDITGSYSRNAAVVIIDLGDPFLANVVYSYDFKAQGFPGTLTGATVSGGNVLANALDRFFTDNPAGPFFGQSTAKFFDPSSYSSVVYTSNPVILSAALRGSLMTLQQTTQTPGALTLEYRLTGPDPFFEAPGNYFFGNSPSAPFFGVARGWEAWPGQILANNTGYQFRVSLGYGATQSQITALALQVDAPDLVESVNNLAIGAAGTVIPYTKVFSALYNIQATLQANVSGGVTVEIDKTNPLQPVARVFNASHTAVNGATVDFVLKGIGI